MMHYGFWGYPGMGSWGWGIGTIFTVVFWIILIILVVSLFKHWPRHDQISDDNALKILKERYAKGDISKKEFEEIKKDIG